MSKKSIYMFAIENIYTSLCLYCMTYFKSHLLHSIKAKIR